MHLTVERCLGTPLASEGHLLSEQTCSVCRRVAPEMVFPIATGIMLRTMYWPTETGAPFNMPKGTCRGRGEPEL